MYINVLYLFDNEGKFPIFTKTGFKVVDAKYIIEETYPLVASGIIEQKCPYCEQVIKQLTSKDYLEQCLCEEFEVIQKFIIYENL